MDPPTRPEVRWTSERIARSLTGLGALALCVLLPGCYGVAPPAQPALTEMHVHFQAAADARRAAIFGDQVALRNAARIINRRGSVVGIPQGQAVMLFDLRQRALEVEESGELADAIGRVPVLLAACGACHEASGLDLGQRFVLREPPDPEAATDPHAQSMNWAVNRLWEGVLGPSDVAWSSGAEAVDEARAWPAAVTEAVGEQDRVDRASAELRRLSDVAIAADRGNARTDLLGQVLLTCSDCHTRRER